MRNIFDKNLCMDQEGFLLDFEPMGKSSFHPLTGKDAGHQTDNTCKHASSSVLPEQGTLSAGGAE